MEILNRTKAPFGAEVWSVIDSTCREFFQKRLNLRGVVDFDDSYNYDSDSISTKELKNHTNKNGISISTREPLKIVEIKKHFDVDSSIIEDIKRGVENFDDAPFANAVKEFSSLEGSILLDGLKEANIGGILKHKDLEKVELKGSKEILLGVAKSLGVFRNRFVDGPFVALLSSATLAKLYTEFYDGMSLKSKLDEILGTNSIVVSEDIGDNSILILSQRGGDFIFYSGLDISIGFEKCDDKKCTLFLLETMAFRVYDCDGALLLNY